jgi:hypothetical protein
MYDLPSWPSSGRRFSGTSPIQLWSEMSASTPVGASCWTAIAEPLPGQTTNRSGALPPPSWARSEVCRSSTGAKLASIFTFGATFSYSLSSASNAGLPVTCVKRSVTCSPPPPPPAALSSSCVPLPHALTTIATAATVMPIIRRRGARRARHRRRCDGMDIASPPGPATVAVSAP